MTHIQYYKEIFLLSYHLILIYIIFEWNLMNQLSMNLGKNFFQDQKKNNQRLISIDFYKSHIFDKVWNFENILFQS